MICPACKYEFKEGIDENNDWRILKGDDEFIHIEGHFTIDDRGNRDTVGLYGCPKCNCVQFEY